MMAFYIGTDKLRFGTELSLCRISRDLQTILVYVLDSESLQVVKKRDLLATEKEWTDCGSKTGVYNLAARCHHGNTLINPKNSVNLLLDSLLKKERS